MEAAIEASGLVKRYGEVEALRGLSLAVPPGTIMGLLGPNGAGKSTTVRVLCTLSRPDGGRAQVAGIDVLAEPARVRSVIGVVGQQRGSAPEATGRENLVLQGEFHGISGRMLKRRVGETLDRFGLAEAADRPARTYSGGMLRRLDIAMGLIQRPRVLFLDEPTTGLDPEVRAEMWSEIAELATEEAITVLLTTHYMEEADRLASRVAIVDRGRIVAEGDPEELKRQLNGDTIQLQFADGDGQRGRHVLADLDGVSEVELDEAGEVEREGVTIRARVRDGAAALPAVLGAFDRAGLTVSSVTLARPTLDDVYMRHAGQSLREPATGAEREEVLR